MEYYPIFWFLLLFFWSGDLSVLPLPVGAFLCGTNSRRTSVRVVALWMPHYVARWQVRDLNSWHWCLNILHHQTIIAHDDNLLFVCFFWHLCKAVYIDRVKTPGLHYLSALKETKTALFDQTGQKGLYSYPSFLNSSYSMTCRQEWAFQEQKHKNSLKSAINFESQAACTMLWHWRKADRWVERRKADRSRVRPHCSRISPSQVVLAWWWEPCFVMAIKQNIPIVIYFRS